MLEQEEINEVESKDEKIQRLEQTLQSIIEKHKEEIQELRDYYEDIIAIMPGHVYWLDRNHVYLGCNNLQARHINLKDRKEIVGKTNKDIVAEDLAQTLDEINEQVMQSGEKYFHEETGELAKGFGVYLTEKVPIKNKQGQVIGLIGISLDITEHKRAEELAKDQARLEEQQKITELYAERMKLLGASIAHELKTPLISIHLLSESLNYYLKNQTSSSQLPIMQEASLSIYKESKNALHMMEMLLSNIRYQTHGIDTSEFKTYSMLEVVKQALKRYPFVETYQSESVFLQAKADDDFNFFGSDLLMMQILFNLLKNALHVIRIEKKGIITIWFTSNEEGHQLHFRDTARGISEEIQQKLFKEFFSTKKYGAGIGLSFCKLVMESMNGSISCEAKEGEYAEFILRFPKIIS